LPRGLPTLLKLLEAKYANMPDGQKNEESCRAYYILVEKVNNK
jgi:hypothetical protein